MKSDLQKFNDFKKRHSFSYRDLIGMISEYAQTDDECARTYFSEKYNISVGVFYKARDFAVICHLIDDDMCKILEAKTARNYSMHNEEKSKVQSYKHFADLMERREAFFYSFTYNEITEISNEYAEGIALRVISDKYEICEKTVKKLLKRGIEDFIISTKLVEAIKHRVISERGNAQAFLRMENNRSITRTKIMEPLEKEIDVLKYQIENYDSYFCGCKHVPDKDFLVNRLEEVEEKYRKILKF